MLRRAEDSWGLGTGWRPSCSQTTTPSMRRCCKRQRSFGAATSACQPPLKGESWQTVPDGSAHSGSHWRRGTRGSASNPRCISSKSSAKSRGQPSLLPTGRTGTKTLGAAWLGWPGAGEDPNPQVQQGTVSSAASVPGTASLRLFEKQKHALHTTMQPRTMQQHSSMAVHSTKPRLTFMHKQ